MTDLQRKRLEIACAALTAAGAQKLPERLTQAFVTGDSELGAEILRQARAWCATLLEGNSAIAKARARDAVGALWAVAEHLL
jgi:hypothetical protein